MILNLSNILISYVLVIILDMGSKELHLERYVQKYCNNLCILLIRFSIDKKGYDLNLKKVFSIDEIVINF